MKKNKSFVLSDESVNTYGFRLLTAGADLNQFRRNPVMYMNHADWSLPIGRWENIRVDGVRILADPVFDMDDEVAREVAGKVERGFLKMASVGLRVVERSEDATLMLPGQKLPTITKWQLREVSIVGIGANHNAIRLYDENDKQLSDDEILKLFDNVKPILKTENMNKELLTLLNLEDTATDEQLHDAVKNIVDRNETLEAENKTLADEKAEREKADKEARDAEAVRLVDEAVKDGRLNAEGKADFLKFFETDFETAKKMLTNIPKRPSVKKEIERQEQQNTGELADLNAKSWDELDKGGKLQTLRDEYPDIYAEKFKAKFGKDPSVV